MCAAKKKESIKVDEKEKNDEKKEIIESLFSGKIKDIFSHYFL